MGHGLGPTRARVLDRLSSFDGGTSAASLAEELSLHTNTARFHLEALVESGFARRTHAEPTGQGRPRTLYHSTPQAPVVDTTHLKGLTTVLVHHLILSSPDPAGVAMEVGRAWGEQIAENTPAPMASGAGATNVEQVQELVDHAVAMGFDTQASDDETLTFHTCPYRNIPQPALASICQMHLGMMQGLLEANGAGIDVTSLQPGTTCVAKLGPRAVPFAGTSEGSDDTSSVPSGATG